MNQFTLLTACFVFFTIIGCAAKPNSNPYALIRGGYDEAEMVAATERAISEVDLFIAELQAERSENHAVKVPIEDKGEIEHFWLIDVTFAGDKFSGTINNDPEMVSNVSFGQKWTLGKTEISDWMYMRDGKMYGNYTLRPLLATMPTEQAEQFRAMLAIP